MVTVSIRNSNFSLLSSSSLFSVPRFVSDLKKPSLYPQVSRSQIVFWHLFKKSEFSHFHRDIYIQIYFENMGYALTVIWKDVCLISIDTSAKEVTKRLCNWEDVRKISIHTSAKEVTGMLHQIVMGEHDFNPHFREGNDRADNHGPACHWDFNPHFREGSDARKGGAAAGSKNSNPHFREGSDAGAQNGLDFSGISIHTSAKEVTPTALHISLTDGISIHTSAKEVTI